MTKGIIRSKFINNFEVGWHLGKFVFGAKRLFLDLWVPFFTLQEL